MSRPPRFRTAYSTTGEPLPGQRILDYLPDELADFVAAERDGAATDLGFPEASAEGDFAGTLMELSALVAHVLGAYQDRYANDAFLGTAQSHRSLVRHGRRLAYEPSPGVAATGYLLLGVKESLSGTVAKGLAVGSAPVGEKKAQDYETLEDVAVDAALAELLPDAALAEKTLAGAAVIEIAGEGLGIEAGEYVVVQTGQGAFSSADVDVGAYEVTGVEEGGGRTLLTLKTGLSSFTYGSPVLYAKPKHEVRLFGSDSSAATFPEWALKLGEYAQPPDPWLGPAYGYEVSPSHDADDVYLAEDLTNSHVDTPVIRIEGASPTAFKATASATKNVTFKRVEHLAVEDGDNNTIHLYPTVSITRDVTALQVANSVGSPQPRSTHAIRAGHWLLGFEVVAPIVTTEPNPAPATQPVVLSDAVEGLAPGMLVALAPTAPGDTTPVEIARLTSVAPDPVTQKTSIRWELLDPESGGASWELGNLRILGNVAPVSHGKTVSEVLGDSDGTRPFLRFALKQKPLTHLSSKDGAEPALELRVGDVLWTRVLDFESSAPHDRHYLVQIDESGTVSVVFGDGKRGAVPPAGKKHITATYRIGIGTDGNAGAGAVSRLKKAHPLLESAANPRAVTGGAAAAELEDVRAQATGYIRTFDRAVSVEDHKHLALLFPGVVKANAAWTKLPSGEQGVLVIVANAEGGAPATAPVEEFLQARRDDSVPLHVEGPTAVSLRIRLYIEVDAAFEKEIVERRVQSALAGTSADDPGLFTFAGRDLGQPAFLSEVHERLERQEGVLFVRVLRLDTAEAFTLGEPVRVVDTFVARPDEYFVMTPEDIEFAPAEAS